MEALFQVGVKGLLRDPIGKILLLQVNKDRLAPDHTDNNYWDLPGGRVKEGDSIEDTLNKEIREEIGITRIAQVRRVAMDLSNIRVPLPTGGTAGLILAVYECQTDVDLTTVTPASEEHVAAGLFTPPHAGELLSVKYPTAFCERVAALPYPMTPDQV